MDDLLSQPYYVVTPSTGVVHSIPCIRNAAQDPHPWPAVYDRDDRACSHCLPDGLPAVKQVGGWWFLNPAS